MKLVSTSVLTCLLLVVIPSSARGQAAETDADVEAKAKLAAGRAARQNGDCQGAAILLEQSIALSRSAAALANLGHCEEKLGRLATAARHYEEALALLPQTAKHREDMQKEIARLRPRVPTLRIQIDDTAPAGTVVLLDERELALSALNVKLPMDPGTYKVLVRAPGREVTHYQVSLTESRDVPLVVAPGPETRTAAVPPSAAAASARPATRPDSGAPPISAAPLRVAAFGALGLSGAAILLGAVTGGLAVSMQKELQNTCPGTGARLCDPGLQPLHAGATTLAHTSTAAFVGAGVALLSGATMLLIASRADRTSRGIGLGLGPASFSVQAAF